MINAVSKYNSFFSIETRSLHSIYIAFVCPYPILEGVV